MNSDAKGKKKVWQKPELVILTRSTPEEAVLTTCKQGALTIGPLGNCAQGGGCSANKPS